MRKIHGFTFVELLIAAVLSALVLSALYSGFKSGVFVWRHAQQNNIKQEEIILFTEKLSGELSNSFVFTGIGFKGEAFEVSFPSLLISTTREEIPVLIRKPGRVVYNWDEENKLVSRRQYDYSQIYQDQEDVPARELVAGIIGVTFAYYKYDADAEDYIWSEEWLEGDQLPQAVKVEIKFKDTKDNEKTITRIIPIPNG